MPLAYGAHVSHDRLSVTPLAEPEEPRVTLAPQVPSVRDGLTPATLLALQRTGGNTATRALISRRPGDPETVPQKIVRLLKAARADHVNESRDTFLRACMEGSGQLDAVETEWKKDNSMTFLQAAGGLAKSTADGARAYAYLKFGSLRLADKLFIASIDAGTDNATIRRLLPQVKAELTKVDAEFHDSYAIAGQGAFGPHYLKTADLPNGVKSSSIAGLLDEEADTPAESIEFRAMLVYGKPRPVDKVKIALESIRLTAGDVMAALEGVVKEAPPGATTELAAAYKASYTEDLLARMKLELGDGSRKYKKAEKIVQGTWTPKARILWACEGADTDMDELWAALDAARADPKAMADLQADFQQKGEVWKALDDEWLSSDTRRRIAANVANSSGMQARLAQQGVDIKDTKAVIRAALEHVEVGAAFAAEWKPSTDFWKAFTDDGKRGVVWGDRITGTDLLLKVDTAFEGHSGDGVVGVLAGPGVTDEQRKKVRENSETITRLKKLDQWARIEPLLQPVDDLRARADFLKQKFEGEAGGSIASSWRRPTPSRTITASSTSMLGKTKDPHNLTPEERKKIGPLAKGNRGLARVLHPGAQRDGRAGRADRRSRGGAARHGGHGRRRGSGDRRAYRARRARAGPGQRGLGLGGQARRATGGEVLRAFAVGAAGGAAGAWAGPQSRRCCPPRSGRR